MRIWIFLEVAKKNFNINGLEICEEAVNDCRARGLTSVYQGVVSFDTLLKMPMADLIVLLDFIEHLPESRVVMEAAVYRLKPGGGSMLISTGDFASLSAKLMGRFWRFLTSPQYLCFFLAFD